MKKLKLGELLLSEQLVTEEQLEDAYVKQKETGQKLGATLVDMGFLVEEQLLELLAKQLKCEYVNLDSVVPERKLARMLPEAYARQFKAIPLSDDGLGGLRVGLADPLNIGAVDELQRVLKLPFEVCVVSEAKLSSALDSLYQNTEEISEIADELSEELAEQDDLTSLFGDSFEADEAPVVKLLLSVFKEAVSARASDIHLEPGERVFRIRLRIDGRLQEKVIDDERIARPLIQRLKMRANLDISERRLPQDGRFHMHVQGKAFDVRVSTLPIAHGESVVMRLLDQSSPVQDLTSLGMPISLVDRIKKIYHHPHGMLLVTGPTGSGKTTSLYSILTNLNTSDRKIITVEDPIEYKLKRINQVQVNAKIDLNFANVLRAILRQDPDVIMVGEIRDLETATIAMRAAVTGHFVLATMHTNDVVSSALRLMEMGIKGYMVASSVKGILAQRLVRVLCDECSEAFTPEEESLAWMKQIASNNEHAEQTNFKRPVGCNVCHQSGYKGRMGVYEFLEMDAKLAACLRMEDPEAFAQAVNAHPNFITMANSVLSLVYQGSTSIEEAIRLVGEYVEVDAT